ncbi:hypothetical protein BT96DRAFT_914811 [Gymnopus androsaceus JB14]|uniref:Uncharacterized protein n=1 Tax=Gymnopus androsaceus JB14 TaxID=1447944 RepID=A0A6A4I9F5_9AGAR|nr:hypothetical protein BT96DRAFT_914811 [Gymnopus androsaceus JB14]
MLLFSPVMFFITLDPFALLMYLPTLNLCAMDYFTSRYRPHQVLYFSLSVLNGVFFISWLYTLSLVFFICWLRFREQHPLRLLFAIPNKTPRPNQSPLSRVLLGRKRSDDERQIIKEQVSTVIFRHTIFRKHPFEPSSLGIVRGLEINTTSNSLFTTQTTMVATENTADTTSGNIMAGYGRGMVFFIAMSSTTQDALSDLAISVDGSDVPCSPQFSVFSGTSSARNCTSDSEVGIIEISTSSNSTISVWVMNSDTSTSGWEETAASLSPPYFLLPNRIVTGSTYLSEYIITNNSSITWVSYVIANPQTVSLSNTTSLKLDASLPTLRSQMYMPVEEFTSSTTLTAILSALSKAGGLFASANGFFVLLFGRSVWAVIAGGRPLSPFGIFGWIPSVKRNIHLHYPLLQSECEKGGMASFVEEVGMNVGIVTHREVLCENKAI